jgi:putative acetyltransferase
VIKSSASFNKPSFKKNLMTANADNIYLRPIQEKDNAAIAALIRYVFIELGIPKVGSAYADPMLDHLYEHYQAQGRAYFVLEKNGGIVGGAGIGPLDGATCELQKMYLSQRVRGLGQGERLIQHCLNVAHDLGYQQCYLETMPSMASAQKLYEKMGFQHLDHAMGNTGHHSCPVWMLKKF